MEEKNVIHLNVIFYCKQRGGRNVKREKGYLRAKCRAFAGSTITRDSAICGNGNDKDPEKRRTRPSRTEESSSREAQEFTLSRRRARTCSCGFAVYVNGNAISLPARGC